MANVQEREFLVLKLQQFGKKIAELDKKALNADHIAELTAFLANLEKSSERFLLLHHEIIKRVKESERLQVEAQILNNYLLVSDNCEVNLQTMLNKVHVSTSAGSRGDFEHQPTVSLLVKSLFDQQKTVMQDLMGNHKTDMEAVASAISGHSSRTRVKLPQLQLPPFSGKLVEWQQFNDLFKVTIHENENLQPVEKFQYLKAAISGEAASTIKDFPVSAVNYHQAWDVLVNRYNKTKHIVFEHIKRFNAQAKKVAKSPADLRQTFTTFEGVIRAVDALNTTTRDSWLICTALEALDQESRNLWSRTPIEGDAPTWVEFMKFLEERCESWESCWEKGDDKNVKNITASKPPQSQKSAQPQKPAQHIAKTHSQPVSSFVTTVDNTKKCHICSTGNHHESQCSKLLEVEPAKRVALVKASKLCFNCLRASHTVRECRSSNCKTCNGRHNTLLHETFNTANAQQSQTQEAAPKSEQKTSQTTSTLVNHVTLHTQGYRYTVLPSVQVFVTGRDGRKYACRALLDSCSQTNSITRMFSEKLGLPLKTSHVSVVKGIGAQSHSTPQAVSAKIEDRSGIFSMILEFLVMQHITDDQPNIELKMPYEIPAHVTLADPQFDQPGRIDMFSSVQFESNCRSVRTG